MITAGLSEKLTLLNCKVTCIHVCEQIAANPDIIPRLTDKLHSKEFITLDTQQAVNYTPSLSPYERATRIMTPAINRCTHRNVDQLIEILEQFLIDIWPPQEERFS